MLNSIGKASLLCVSDFTSLGPSPPIWLDPFLIVVVGGAFVSPLYVSSTLYYSFLPFLIVRMPPSLIYELMSPSWKWTHTLFDSGSGYYLR